jgi:hypothetical protein
MTQTLEEFRAQMKRELSAAANEDLKTEVQRVQKARGCSFDEAWRRTEREQPGFFRVGAAAGCSSESESPQSYLQVEARAQKLIYASGGTLPMSEALNRARGTVVDGSLKLQDPRIAQEMARHKKLDDSRQSGATDDHVDRMVKIRKLMTEKNMTFDAAFTQICQQESGMTTVPATATLTTSMPAAKVEAGDEPESPPHPGQSAAIAKGLLLIEGGFCTPLHGKE